MAYTDASLITCGSAEILGNYILDETGVAGDYTTVSGFTWSLGKTYSVKFKCTTDGTFIFSLYHGNTLVCGDNPFSTDVSNRIIFNFNTGGTIYEYKYKTSGGNSIANWTEDDVFTFSISSAGAVSILKNGAGITIADPFTLTEDTTFIFGNHGSARVLIKEILVDDGSDIAAEAVNTFTTVERVRSEAGFDANSLVTDATIQEYLDQGHAIVLGVVAGVYSVSSLAGVLFTGSHAEDYLKRAEELIAAGYLLQKDYGSQEFDTDKDGIRKFQEGMDRLTALTEEPPVRLLDVNNDEFTRVSPTIAGSPVAGISSSSTAKFSVDDTY
jgi:hypothetical protein